MKDVRIETERLVMVPADMSWRDDMLRMFNEPGVADWLFLTGPPTLDELTKRIEVHEAFWREHGFGLFAVIEKSSGRFVARVGPMPTLGPGLAEVAWSTVAGAWGKGYASEAALASMKFTFARSPVETLSCFLRPDNTASRRVAEKIGFRYHDTRFLYGRQLRYYLINREGVLRA